MTAPPDIVMVLGAALAPDGTPGVPLIRRTRHGARLAMRHGAVLLLSGGRVRGPIPEAEAMEAIARATGMDPTKIVQEPTSRTTWENFAHARGLIPEGAVLWVVTDPSHAFRARMLARRQGLQPRMALTWGARPRTNWHRSVRTWLREIAATLAWITHLRRPGQKG